MHYDGKPRFQMPSRQYHLFIKQLEKATAGMQESFKKLERMENLYNICREALEAFDSDSKSHISLELQPQAVVITIQMLYEDRFDKFNPLIEQIEAELFRRDLVKEKGSNFRKVDYKSQRQTCCFTIKNNSFYRQIYIHRHLPNDGTIEFKIERKYTTKSYSYQDLDLTLVPRLNNIPAAG